MPNKIRTKYRFHRIIFVVLWCAITFCSCSSHINDELHTAYSLCATQPDSALAILQSIKPHMADASPKEKALYDISYEASYYIKHKVPTISADSALAYIDQSYGQELYLMKRILCGIHMFKSKKMEEAFASFNSCSKELDANIHPYWKCVVDDYLGIIYLNSRVMEKSKEHFFRVLHRAEDMKDIKSIAYAYSHISTYYHVNNQLDSALFYATNILKHEKEVDSTILAAVYHNLANIQRKIATSQDNQILNNLKLSKSFKINPRVSLITDALFAQFYYSNGIIDSAKQYHTRVTEGENDIACLVLYNFLADYYNKKDLTDSAYKYLKLYETTNAELANKRNTQSILNIYHQQNYDYSEKRSSRQKLYIITGALLVIVSTIIILGLGHHFTIKRAKKRNKEHESKIFHLSQQKNNLQTQLKNQNKMIAETIEKKQHIEKELAITQDTLLKATRKIESYTTNIAKKNSMLAKVNREKERAEHNALEQSDLAIQKFLNKNECLNDKLTKAQMEYIIKAYASHDDNRNEFIHQLKFYGKDLTPTSTIICILYHEHFTDEDIIQKLHYEPKNFRMAKSRARAALDTIGNAQTKLIQKLLKRFDYKKESK